MVCSVALLVPEVLSTWVTFGSSVCMSSAPWWTGYKPEIVRFAIFFSSLSGLELSIPFLDSLCFMDWGSRSMRDVADGCPSGRSTIQMLGSLRAGQPVPLKFHVASSVRGPASRIVLGLLFSLRRWRIMQRWLQSARTKISRSICKGLHCKSYLYQVLLYKGLVVIFMCIK